MSNDLIPNRANAQTVLRSPFDIKVHKLTFIEKNNDDIYKIETFEKYLSIEIDADEYGDIFSNNFKIVDELREFIKGFVEICNTHLGENIRRKVNENNFVSKGTLLYV